MNPGIDTKALYKLISSLVLALAALFGLIKLVDYSNPRQAEAAVVKVGLLADGPSVNDGGFVWSSYQGLLRAQSDLGVVGTVYTSTSPSTYAANIEKCVSDGNDLCISIGFLWANDTETAANAHPAAKFALIDYAYSSYPSNLRGVTFGVNEAAYLAGTLAGMRTTSNKLGVIAGMNIPQVNDFIFTFQDAAHCINPAASTTITYTNDFVNPNVGAQTAQAMMAQGVDVIYGVGGNMGAGAILTATQSGAWAIGVDADYYYTVFNGGTVPGADRLLTSVLKRLDNAVYNTISDVVAGTFTPGTLNYTLALGGVGLAPFHDADPFITPRIRSMLSLVQAGIMNGSINVNGPGPNYSYISLPTVLKGAP